MGAIIGILYPDIANIVSTQDRLFFLRIRDEAGKSQVQTLFNVFSEI